MKLYDIIKITEAIKKIVDEGKLSPSVKFKLLCIIKQLEPQMKSFEDMRNELIRKYSTSDNGIIPPEEGCENYEKKMEEYNSAMTKFNNDIEVLLNSDIDIHINKLKADDVFTDEVPASTFYPIIDLIEL